jgi:hypothetical protein
MSRSEQEQTRQKVLLGLLALLLVVLGWVYVPGLLSGDGGAGGGGRRDARSGPTAADRVAVEHLELGRLSAEPRDYDPGRNPFTYYTPPPPPPPGPTPEELERRAELERQRAEAERLRRAAEAEAEANAPPPKPTPPAFQLTYLGSFGPEGRKIAVFTDGEEIYNAVVGDVLSGSFAVSEIGFESVTITYVDFPDEPARRVGIGG